MLVPATRSIRMLAALVIVHMGAFSLDSAYIQIDSEVVDKNRNTVTGPQDIVAETIMSVNPTHTPNKPRNPEWPEATDSTQNIASMQKEISDMPPTDEVDSTWSTNLQDTSSEGNLVTNQLTPTGQSNRKTESFDTTMLPEIDERTTSPFALSTGSIFYNETVDMNSAVTADDGDDRGSKTSLAVEKNVSFVDDSYSVAFLGTSYAHAFDAEVDTTLEEEEETITTQVTADIKETQGDWNLLDKTSTQTQRFDSVEPNKASSMHSKTHMPILTTVGQQNMQESPSKIESIAKSITESSLLYSQEHILQTQTYSQTIASEPPVASDTNNNTGLKATATEYVEQKLDTRSTAENDEQTRNLASMLARDSLPTHDLQVTSLELMAASDESQEDKFMNLTENHDNAGEATDGEPNFETQTTDALEMGTEEPIVSDRCLQATDCPTSFDNNNPSANTVSEVTTLPFNTALTSAVQNNPIEEKVSTEVVRENATKAFKSAAGRPNTTGHSMQPLIQTEESFKDYSEADSEPSILPASTDSLGTTNDTLSTSGPTEGSVLTDVFGSENVHIINHTQILATGSIQDAQAASLAGDFMSSRTDIAAGQFESYSTPNARVIQAETADMFGTGDDKSFLQTTSVRTESILSTDVMDPEAVYGNNQTQVSVTSSIQDVHASSTRNEDLPSMADFTTRESVPYSTHVMQTDIEIFASQPSTLRVTDRSTDTKSHPSNMDMVEQNSNQSQVFEAYTSVANVDISESKNNCSEFEVSSEENSKVSAIQTLAPGISRETQRTNQNASLEIQMSVSPMTSFSLDGNGADEVEAFSSREVPEYHFDASTQAAVNIGSSDDGTTHASSGYITKLLPVSASSASSSEPTAAQPCSNDCDSKHMLIKNVKSEPKAKGSIKSTASGEHVTDDRASSQPADTSTKALMPIAGSDYRANDQKTEVSTSAKFIEMPTNAVGRTAISMTAGGMEMYTSEPVDSLKSLRGQPTDALRDIAQNRSHNMSVQTDAQPSGIYEENGGEIKPTGPSRTDLTDPAKLKSTEATSGGNKKATSAPIALGGIGSNLFNLHKCPMCKSASKLAGPLVVDVAACLLMLQM